MGYNVHSKVFIFCLLFLINLSSPTISSGVTLANFGICIVNSTSLTLTNSGTGNSFNNYNIMTILGGISIQISFNNNGTVYISSSDSLTLSGTSTINGNISISSGGSMTISATTTFSSGYLYGTGSLIISTSTTAYLYGMTSISTVTISGTAYINSNFAPTTATISGILGISGTVSISSGVTITCASGCTINGGGTLSLSSGVFFNLGTSSTPGSETFSSVILNSFTNINHYG